MWYTFLRAKTNLQKISVKMVYDTLYLTLLYRGLRDRSRSIFGVLTSFKKKSTSFCKNFFSKKIILILFFFFFNFFPSTVNVNLPACNILTTVQLTRALRSEFDSELDFDFINLVCSREKNKQPKIP